MSKHRNRAQWALFVGLTFGLVASALTHAGQPKPKLDLEAEAKQTAEEELKEALDHAQGIKAQRVFWGTFSRLSDAPAGEKLGPEVIGTFVSARSEPKPGRTYLVKAEKGTKNVLEELSRYDGKPVKVHGRLRVIGPDGEAKYLVVINVVSSGPSPPAVERRRMGGL
jgi:hypothetical protein